MSDDKIMLTEDVKKVLSEVLLNITQNVRSMMDELWMNWSHLGVEVENKIANMKQLVEIEKDLHRDVLTETRRKLKAMEEDVEKLKAETAQLSKSLSVDITILEFKDELMLVEYKKELENQIVGYRELVKQRKSKIKRLMEWQQDLASKLGITITELNDDPLPPEEELDQLQEQLTMWQSERDKRAEIFLNTQIEVRELMNKLQLKPMLKFEHVVVNALSVDFKVNDSNMQRLAKLHQDLQKTYEQTNNRVLELRERLARLWECLDEDQIFRENFLQAHPGCSPDTENALREEIKRCEQIKRQQIQVFVANMRTKIKLMWDNCMYSAKDREEFLHYYRDVFSEDTLVLHELYLEKLTKHYNDHKNIFELVTTRKELWFNMCELEARASEPGRYQNRGGQLLKEERERKTLAVKLPKIEVQLKDLAVEFETTHGKPFKVDGKPLLELIEEDWATRKNERHTKLSARKQALTPQANTPLLRSLATSPLGKRNRTAAGLVGTAEKNRPPSKRLLITGSASKAMPTHSNLSTLKRSAVSTVKRRLSGRIAARALAANQDSVRRQLHYGDNKTKKVTVNGNILKHKRNSTGKRRSGGKRRSNSTRISKSMSEEDHFPPEKPVTESTLLTSYTDFKEHINEKQSRSSILNNKQADIPKISMCSPVIEKNTPKKTPIPKTPMAFTPKIGKENIQHINDKNTPKFNPNTPNKLTRSTVKLDNHGFAAPRTPFSATKGNFLPRQNTVASLPLKTLPNLVNRSKSQSQLIRAKNLPPLL